MTVAPLLIGVPLAAALLCAALGRGAAAVSAAASVVTLAMGIFVALGSFAGPAERAFGGLVYVDALSGLIVLIVALVSAIAALYAVAYIRNAVAADEIAPSQVRWFYFWLQLSIAAMFAVPVLNNLGLMWVAIEMTTLTTALLVAFFRRGHALEAAWKYLMLGAVGLAFGLYDDKRDQVGHGNLDKPCWSRFCLGGQRFLHCFQTPSANGYKRAV